MKLFPFKRIIAIYTFTFILLFNNPLIAQINYPVFVTDSLDFTSSNLPIVRIETYGATIVDEYRIEAHMGIIDNGEGNRNNGDKRRKHSKDANAKALS